MSGDTYTVEKLAFKKELYPKVALIKAAYNYTDRAYIHLDADDDYYYVSFETKDGCEISEQNFLNEILAQTARHEIYQQTKNIRELLLARALATSVVFKEDNLALKEDDTELFDENEILKDWFR